MRSGGVRGPGARGRVWCRGRGGRHRRGRRRGKAGTGHGEGGWAQVAEREGARVRVSRGRAWERGAKDLVEESRGEGCTHHTYNRLP